MSDEWSSPDEIKTKKKEAAKKPSAKSLFKPAIDIPKAKRIRCGLFSRAKAGKTHFALTAKRPIYFLDTEKSAQLLVKQLPEDVQREIYILDLVDFAERKGNHLDVVQSMEVAFDVIGELLDDIRTSPEVGTIVIDSMTDLWDYLKIWLDENVDQNKKFGDTIMGTEWGKANKRWKELMNLLKASDWNVILTFKTKERYVDKKASGIIDPDWQKNTFHDLDLNFEIVKTGDEHRFICHGGRFGDKYEDLINPTFDDVRKYLQQKTGIEFE